MYVYIYIYIYTQRSHRSYFKIGEITFFLYACICHRLRYLHVCVV